MLNCQSYDKVNLKVRRIQTMKQKKLEHKIKAVEPDSIARELELEPGLSLIHI